MPTIATGLKVSISNTPQAKDDVYGSLEDFSKLLDVLCNDLGGTAKTLYSLSRDLTIEDGGTVTSASLICGVPVQSITTNLGATATIVDGMISYVTNGLDFLAEGQDCTDVFSYVIRLSSGAFSIATVSVTVSGSNDAPDIHFVTGDSAAASLAETDAPLIASGSLTVTDVDTIDTVDVTVSGVVASGTGGTGGISNDDLKAMLSLTGHIDNAADGTAGSLDWSFDSGSEAFDYLAQGETLILTYTLTATDSAPYTPLSDTQTVTITITGTNDAPVLTVTATGSLAEDGDDPILSTSGSLDVTDVDATDSHVITTGVTSVVWSGGSLSLDDQAALAAGFTADADSWDYSVANSAVQFLDDGETLVLTFSVTVTDDSGALNNSDTKAVAVTITGANDAPELTGTAASLPGGLEDNSYTVTQAQLLAGWTDVDEETLVASGLTATNGTVVANADGSYTITPSANYYGPVTLNYSVGDGTASVAAILSYTLASVNDAPAGADKTLTILEDGSHGFTAADFGFSDPNDAPANALLAVKITTLPGAGSLTLGGVAVTLGQWVSLADINAGLLAFTPAANANGAGYASFTFQVRDDGGTANGGIDTDQSANTITVNVTPVNDAPVNTVPGSQSVDEDTALAIAGVSVGDIDSASLTTTLSVDHGTLDVTNVVGLGIVGDGTGTVVLTGSAAQINAALAGLRYTGNADYFGADTLTVETDDGDLTDTDTVAITVNAVEDGITITGLHFAPNASAGNNLNLGAFVADGATGAVTYDASVNAVGGATGAASIDVLSDGTLDLAGGPTPAGQFTLAVSVYDGGGNVINTFTYTLWIGTNDANSFTFTLANDSIGAGRQQNDTIVGNSGQDYLFGGSDADRLVGNGGDDWLSGGGGNDTFGFIAPSGGGTDEVADFDDGGDRIALLQGGDGWNAAATTATSAGATLSATDYVNTGRTSLLSLIAGDNNKVVELQAAQSTAHMAGTLGAAVNAYVLVFNSDTGFAELWHDNNWSDAASRTQVMTFESSGFNTLAELQALTNSDFAEWLGP